MRTNLPPATLVLALSLAAACDDGRYLVGILAQPPNQPGAGGTSGAGGPAGPKSDAAPLSPPVGGADGGSSQNPAASVCSMPSAPLPARASAISSAQLAERLARLLWNQRPDQELLGRTDKLTSNTQVMGLARQMLLDPRATDGVRALMNRWLRLEEVRGALGAAAVRAQITQPLRESMLRESELFTEHVMLEGDGRLDTLLTARFSFLDQALADIYGVSRPAPDVFQRTDLNPNQRSGVLTQASTLFVNPRATHRGLWLNRALLCRELPAPPASIEVPNLEDPSARPQTSRERLRAATAAPPCRACHELMDPPGFAFEHHDPLGRWRETEAGLAVDTSGTFMDSQGNTVPFRDAIELGRQLVNHCEVQTCAARTFLQQALGGESPRDEPSLRELWAAFAASGFNLRELMIAVTGSEAFLNP